MGSVPLETSSGYAPVSRSVCVCVCVQPIGDDCADVDAADWAEIPDILPDDYELASVSLI